MSHLSPQPPSRSGKGERVAPPPTPNAQRLSPVGVFDSGVGGLTVVAALLRRYPAARVLYLADQGHVPYGGRPLDEVRGFAGGISRFLAGQGCRAVVMACNISSAVALTTVRAELAPLPVFGVIDAAARRAANADTHVGVLATAGTVTSGAYTRQITAVNPNAQVREVACPRFVPLVEAGELDGPEALDAAREYLRPLAEAGCRSIILGCTHYPFLLPALRIAAGGMGLEHAVFIDPAEELVAELAAIAGESDAQNRLLTTGDLARFKEQIPLFIPTIEPDAGAAAWHAGQLTIVDCQLPIVN